MEFDIKKKDGVTIVKPLVKSIEAANNCDFKSKLIELVDQGDVLMILNLSQVEFMDSSGLGNLISILKLLAHHQGNIALCALQEPIKKILSLTRLNQVFAIFPNEEEATKNIKIVQK